MPYGLAACLVRGLRQRELELPCNATHTRARSVALQHSTHTINSGLTRMRTFNCGSPPHVHVGRCPCGAATCTAPPAEEGGGALQKGGVVVGTGVHMYSQRILNSRLVFVIRRGPGMCWCGPAPKSLPVKPRAGQVRRAMSPALKTEIFLGTLNVATKVR